MPTQKFVMRLSCQNRPGIVAAVSGQLFEAGFNILDSQQFDDTETDMFFVRIAVECEREFTRSDMQGLMQPLVQRFDMELDVRDTATRQRVAILASKADHCLADLLYRWRSGDLDIDVVAVISNHPREVYPNLNLNGVTFHYMPMEEGGKAEQESRILALLNEVNAELVVLARYMQILSDDMAGKLAGRCINIHHSFLPGFKGARPYHQAHIRGVKLIGATAHYVTADLDEGPIIEQDVERISHRDTPDELVRKGRDIERRVLARAVRYHVEGRVLRNGTKTVVFPE